MDVLNKLSREAQVVLAGGVVLLILSFLNWQQVSLSVLGVGGTYGVNEWHGIGFLAALLVIVDAGVGGATADGGEGPARFAE